MTHGEMHRYSASSYGNGFRNAPVGVPPLRDRVSARADSASFTSNHALNSRSEDFLFSTSHLKSIFISALKLFLCKLACLTIIDLFIV